MTTGFTGLILKTNQTLYLLYKKEIEMDSIANL